MSTQYRSLYRSRKDRMIGGVCAGLGEFFGIDPTLVRLGFVLGSVVGFAGPLVLSYVTMMVVVPETPIQVDESPVVDVSPAEE